jgi:hypothetical protein
MVIDFTEGLLELLAETYDISRIDPVHARTTALFAVAGTFELVLAYLSESLTISEERLADEVAALLTQCMTLLGVPVSQ